jgi:hypothetical protein
MFIFAVYSFQHVNNYLVTFDATEKRGHPR